MMTSSEQAESHPRPETEEPPIWEEVMGAVGLILFLLIVGFLVYEAVQPKTPPEIEVSAGEISTTPGGWLVEVRAENRGDSPAAGVIVEGSLLDPAGEPVETVEVTLDYLPELSTRLAGIYFAKDPARFRLELRAKGYVNP